MLRRPRKYGPFWKKFSSTKYFSTLILIVIAIIIPAEEIWRFVHVKSGEERPA